MLMGVSFYSFVFASLTQMYVQDTLEKDDANNKLKHFNAFAEEHKLD